MNARKPLLTLIYAVLTGLAVLGLVDAVAGYLMGTAATTIPARDRAHAVATACAAVPDLVWAGAGGLALVMGVLSSLILWRVRRDRPVQTLLLAHGVLWVGAELVGLAWRVPNPVGVAALVVPLLLVAAVGFLPLRAGREAPTWAWGAVAVVGLALLVRGHLAFSFLCDDAYISFRYISNSQLGFGYVWNAPPFAPVEGYTSFLWVFLLDSIWSLTGADPTISANPISLLFSVFSTALVALMASRMRRSGGLADQHLLVFAVVLLGTVTNRTWLAWTTSGLETSMFLWELLAWFAVLFFPLGRVSWGLLWGLATLLALTRPDGYLFVASTGAAHLLFVVRHGGWASLLLATPALCIPAHLFWRHATYGYWLPNTYYAKHVGAWPLSGFLYVMSFILEQALWLPLGLAVVAVVTRRLALWDSLRQHPEKVLLGGTIVAQWAYYTFNVGGDHFEYRVYAQLVPLLLLLGVWAVDQLFHPRLARSVLVAIVLFGLPIPWMHYAKTYDRWDRKDTRQMVVDLSPGTPLTGSLVTFAFDLTQHWLQIHMVGARHQEHFAFSRYQAELHPTREDGAALSAVGNPVHATNAVGFPAWTMPFVAVVDRLGLNDRVVARNPVHPNAFRRMAHDRRTPEGYVECFSPNVRVTRGKARMHKRELTDEEVVACETTFLERMEALQGH